jgi:hypothetical protein
LNSDLGQVVFSVARDEVPYLESIVLPGLSGEGEGEGTSHFPAM